MSASIHHLTQRQHRAERVAGIEPVDGWVLHRYDEPDGDRFWRDEFIARGPDHDVHLDVSRFHFTPSQGRFAWLVRNGFPPREALGPWCDTSIELRMAEERLAA